MPDEPEAVQGEVVPDGPNPELAPAVDGFAGEVTISDVSDPQEVMLRMDANDMRMLLDQVQSNALRKWVYQLPGGKGTGLTVHAVQDITQRMNWTGKAKIGVLPETLEVERSTHDTGDGPEEFWTATIFARDEVTGAMLPGVSMEPLHMHMRNGDRPFDVFSRTKAVQKATRNALAAFIPEEIEQAVIAAFTGDTSRVERIRTVDEAKIEELPPALTDDRAKALIAQTQALYDEIRELGGGQGKVKFPPGQYQSWLLKSQHDHDALERFVAYLESQLEELPGVIEREGWAREAEESAVKVVCPVCEAAPGKFCKGVRGSHKERMQARYDQLAGGAA